MRGVTVIGDFRRQTVPQCIKKTNKMVFRLVQIVGPRKSLFSYGVKGILVIFFYGGRRRGQRRPRWGEDTRPVYRTGGKRSTGVEEEWSVGNVKDRGDGFCKERIMRADELRTKKDRVESEVTESF